MADRPPVVGLLVVLVAAGVGVGTGWLAGSSGAAPGGVPLLAWCALLAFAIQWAAFVPAALLQTERFYDLTGSLTYLAVVSLALAAAAAEQAPGLRQWVVAAMVATWATRLGGFLVRRIRRVGRDGRFDDMKRRPFRFLVAWSLQGLWVCLTALAALVLLTADNAHGPVGLFDMLGWTTWATGFAIEVAADAQKSRFNTRPGNAGRFVRTGLWRWSRHPNYFGEILLWTGIFVSGLGIYEGGQWLAVLSPIFVTFLLTRVSGIPLLEARADARWADDPEYAAYKRQTNALLPWPPAPPAGPTHPPG